MDYWTHKRDGFGQDGLPLNDISIEERERIEDEKDDMRTDERLGK